jgi:hypothetical protein
MESIEQLRSNFEKIIDLALFAPSVHNTQPWKVKLLDNGLLISLDPAHKLKYGDPTGRETQISLGIFAEAVICSAENLI